MALLQSFLVLLMIFTMGSASADHGGGHRCPSGWKDLGKRCYKHFSQKVKWIKAEKNCQDLGGHLASVSNKPESDFLLGLVPTSSPCWIGASDCVQEGVWLWTDGSTSHYRNWCSGQPDNAGGSENCLQINFSGNHCWNDESCASECSYICAIKH